MMRYLISSKFWLFIVGLLFSNCAFSAGLSDLVKGFSKSEDPIPFADIKKYFGYRTAFLVGLEDVGQFYGLSGDGRGVAYYDLVAQTPPIGWSISRWPHLQLVPEILADHDQVGMRGWNESIEYTPYLPFVGCLNKNPLRYGDIEDDGTPELVLTLNGELIIFSPEYQRTVFAAFFDADDWYRESMQGIGLESDIEEGVEYQYLSAHLLYNGVGHRAHRAYTKLYVGDFDQDGHPDILTWQKIYVSNKVGEVEGFHLLRNEFRHFERDLEAQEASEQGVTGEYLPQSTEQATIQQWLVANEQTWQTGFPSSSECEGQVGQPIQEMSDPLLNDPEVLR